LFQKSTGVIQSSDREGCFRTRLLKPHIIRLQTTSSTNTRAKEMLGDGAPQGTIVLAETQQAGRGRGGRQWFSPLGGLYFSILLDPVLSSEKTPLLGILSACSVASSLRIAGVTKASVKWPNDILVEEAKISGILTESVSAEGEVLGVVVGIGVNVNVDSEFLTQKLEWPATSVLKEVGHPVSPDDLLCHIVNEIDRLLSLVEQSQSFEPILELWRSLTSTLGRRVRIHEEGSIIDGLAMDIGGDGALIVETESGVVQVTIGDVSHLGPT
jgi:BirA family biotin operon repressor/biotin-[acetyl-CoA-carboxylase] ligase